MDNTTTGITKKQPFTSFGLSSFTKKDQEHFGQNIRLAMACVEGEIDITANLADMLELLVRYDDIQGWKSSGAKHFAEWMNLEMSICRSLSFEYLRVGRQLRKLPNTTALFRAGKLTWSKVRIIARVANADTENILCHAALDASVSEVDRLCAQYKWNKEGNGSDTDGDNQRAMQQWNSRSFTWSEASNGNTRIQLSLPPELAQVFMNGIEHVLDQKDDNTMSQSRADAAVCMAETSLQASGQHITTADRYQVIVSVDASELSTDSSNSTLSKRPTLQGATPIATESAKRIACDCSITKNLTINGEPLDIGRKARVWTAAQDRAIRDRDQHCQFYGCTETRYLQIHHIVHWADGGSTSVDNGVCLCSGCHRKVHEGGYTIEWVNNHPERIDEQFTQQQHNNDISMFEFEEQLRNNRDSFNTVRKLSPTPMAYSKAQHAHQPTVPPHPESTGLRILSDCSARQ